MQPFRTILFAADFSERSKEAFRVACALADETRTRLFVVSVVERMPVVEQPVGFGESGGVVPLGGADQAHHEAVKERLREVYTPHRPVDVLYQTREGLAAEELLRTASEIGADLIVLGTHGRTGLRRLLAGSVAEAVLRGARCPVLALRSPELPRATEDLRVILHPTDFSPCSESALRVARSLARDHGARLIVLHVAPLEVLIDGTTAVAWDPQSYRDALEQARGRIEGTDLKYPVETRLGRGDEVTEILQAAQEVECGLIVLGTHGRTGLGRLLMGSVAEAVLRRAACPVLVVKDRRTEPEASSAPPAEKAVASR
jgi:nucleotide-binding universal stress UspA family protein